MIEGKSTTLNCNKVSQISHGLQPPQTGIPETPFSIVRTACGDLTTGR